MYLASALLTVVCHPLLAQSDDVEKLERWDRAVCLVSADSKTKSEHFGTGFLVKCEETFLLVTAKHVANLTNEKTRILFRTVSGKSEWISLAAFVSKNQNPWTHHKISDLSVTVLKRTAANASGFNRLTELSIPCHQISSDSPRRTTEIEVSGFPLGLGIQRGVSPVVVSGTIASKEIDSKTKWGSEPIVYSSPALAQGTSGAPAYLKDNNPARVKLVGIYVGLVFDKTGAKLSKLVPSRTIREFIETIATKNGG